MALRDYELKDVDIGAHSRRRVGRMRRILIPIIRFLSFLPGNRFVWMQLRLSRHLPAMQCGLPVDYDIMQTVPVIRVGHDEEDRGNSRVLLYLHGGGFVMPMMPRVHLRFVARLCKQMQCVGVIPEYRLGPRHPYPAALDDCEVAYRALLGQGYKAENIVLAGESAGGNLVLTVLQRIRRAELPMPAAAVPISPLAEATRIHSPPSRIDNARRDAMLPVTAFNKTFDAFAAGADGSDPELSPVFADFQGFPPLYFLVGEDEVLLDDSLICHRQALRAGVDSRLDVWPVLPHAFPLLDFWFAEARHAQDDIREFLTTSLATSASS